MLVRNWFGALVVIAGCLVTSASFGQTQPRGTGAGVAPSSAAAPSNATLVAVVDMGQIFKNHPRFKQQLEAIKQELVAYEKQLNEQKKAITKEREKQVDLKAGSPEYKRLEEEVARRISDLQVTDQLKKKEVMEREARVFYETYQDVTREIGKLADRYGISLVLRFDSDKIDPNDRNSVLAGINRPVVFQRKLDLTQEVLQSLGATAGATAETAPRSNATSGAATSGATGAAGAGVRPASAIDTQRPATATRPAGSSGLGPNGAGINSGSKIR